MKQKQKSRVIDVENYLMVTKGKEEGGINRETGIDTYILYTPLYVN